MYKKFPIVEAGYIFNEFEHIIRKPKLELNFIEINYPCRLDAMAINPEAVTYNERMYFTPGEVVISTEIYIKVKVKVINSNQGKLIISNRTKRKVLVKHAYLLMCKALKINPSLEIDVDDSLLYKHCGFGSSSSTITAVAACINEIYGNPINSEDLIKYLASNHGEEISDDDEEHLKAVQCIGGGATNGLTKEGIIIIAGKSCEIGKVLYKGNLLIAIPNDFKEQNAEYLMDEEEKNLAKFQKTGEKYKNQIAFEILHKALPELTIGKIEELAKVVFDYRFNMGSIENCSFTFPRIKNIAKNIRYLYEEHHCNLLSLSSVGPAFFAITTNKKDFKFCKKAFEKENMKVIKTKVCNHKYVILNQELKSNYWNQQKTIKEFSELKPSQYIINEIDNIIKNNNIKTAIDIGCGGGRYTKYLLDRDIDTISIDKNRNMNIYKINEKKFINCRMEDIPIESNYVDLALSIGVYHNAITLKEYYKSFEELSRITKSKGYAIVSIFTNDVISRDLLCIEKNMYKTENREPMVLMTEEEINKIIKKYKFNLERVIDEHITNVGERRYRYVYTIMLRKK